MNIGLHALRYLFLTNFCFAFAFLCLLARSSQYVLDFWAAFVGIRHAHIYSIRKEQIHCRKYVNTGIYSFLVVIQNVHEKRVNRSSKYIQNWSSVVISIVHCCRIVIATFFLDLIFFAFSLSLSLHLSRKNNTWKRRLIWECKDRELKRKTQKRRENANNGEMNEKSSNAHSPQKPAKLLSSLALNNKKWHDIPLLSAVQYKHSTHNYRALRSNTFLSKCLTMLLFVKIIYFFSLFGFFSSSVTCYIRPSHHKKSHLCPSIRDVVLLVCCRWKKVSWRFFFAYTQLKRMKQWNGIFFFIIKQNGK